MRNKIDLQKLSQSPRRRLFKTSWEFSWWARVSVYGRRWRELFCKVWVLLPRIRGSTCSNSVANEVERLSLLKPTISDVWPSCSRKQPRSRWNRRRSVHKGKCMLISDLCPNSQYLWHAVIIKTIIKPIKPSSFVLVYSTGFTYRRRVIMTLISRQSVDCIVNTSLN